MGPFERIEMDNAVKDFLSDLLNAPDVPKPNEPDVGKIEELSPENFRLISSIIKICRNITDDQISNYVNYLNKALQNSGEFDRFQQIMKETKGGSALIEEEFI